MTAEARVASKIIATDGLRKRGRRWLYRCSECGHETATVGGRLTPEHRRCFILLGNDPSRLCGGEIVELRQVG